MFCHYIYIIASNEFTSFSQFVHQLVLFGPRQSQVHVRLYPVLAIVIVQEGKCIFENLGLFLEQTFELQLLIHDEFVLIIHFFHIFSYYFIYSHIVTAASRISELSCIWQIAKVYIVWECIDAAPENMELPIKFFR